MKLEMKKYFSLLIVCLLSLGAAHAQLVKHYSVGVRVGGIASAPVPTVLDSGSTGSLIPRPTFGITAQFQSACEHFGLSAGLYYSPKYATYSSLIPKTDTTVWQTVWGVPTMVQTFYKGSVSGRMNLHYLEMPLHASWFPWKSRKLRMDLGTSLSYLFAGNDTGTAKITIGNDFSKNESNFNNIDDIRRFEFGLSAGMSYTLWDRWFVQAHLQRSLRTLYDEDFFSKNGRPESKLYQTGLTAGVGYYFVNRRQGGNATEHF